MPQRSRRVAVLAHCHLDVNTKVHGLAHTAAGENDLVGDLMRGGVAIVQLPCPEVTFLGLRRWGMTYEQYDTPAFRRHCRTILGPVVDTLVALREDGCAIEAIYGVDGSPSCAVAETSVGYEGGDVEDLSAWGRIPVHERAPGVGVFIEELISLLHAAGIDAPTKGVDQSGD